MKRYITTLTLALLATIGVVGAQLQSSYFMTGSSQRYDLNPALSPDRGYFVVPVVGLHTGLYSNFLSAENFFYPTEDGLVTYMNKNVNADDFLGRLADLNRLSFDINDQIIGLGNYFRAGFWSIGVNLRSQTDFNIPKDFFALTKKLAPGEYNIAGFGIETNNYLEASFGYTFPVQDVFTLGFRAKALVGLAHIQAKLDKLNVKIGADEYRAEMAGTIEANVNGMNFEGLSGELTLSDFTDHISNFGQNFSTAGVKSFGMAIDAGIDWLLMDEQLKLSAGVTDLGWTTWSDQNSFCATVENVGYAFQGFDFKAGEAKFEKPENIAIQTTNEKINKKKQLHTTYLAGIEYNYLDGLLGFGALWSGKQYSDHIFHQATAAVTVRPTRWFTFTLSDTFASHTANTLGFALNIHSRLINVFAGMDYVSLKYGTANGGAIPIPLTQKSVNFQLGVSLPLGIRHF